MYNLITSKSIVIIHGMFMNPISWENWITYLEARSYKCYAPAYPFHEGKPADLRKKIKILQKKVLFYNF